MKVSEAPFHCTQVALLCDSLHFFFVLETQKHRDLIVTYFSKVFTSVFARWWCLGGQCRNLGGG